MAAGFPAKTSFSDGSVLPASDLNDLGGTINKIYNSAGYPQQLSFVSTTDSVLRPIPFATSTDRISTGTNISGGAGIGVTVTFTRTNRFTETPIVIPTIQVVPTTAFAACSTASVTTSGFTMRVYNVGSTAITSFFANYIAMQMTSTTADNN
jgi:hypothetical protein